MNKFTKIEKLAAGGMLFLLPFLVFPYGGGDMDLQFGAPKLWGAFLLGNLMLGFLAGRRIHSSFAVAHWAVSCSVLFTGFGVIQLYPYAYWCAALGFSLWVVSDIEDSPRYFTTEGPDMRDMLFKCIAVSGCLVALHAYIQAMGHYWPIAFAEGITERPPLAFFGQHTKLGAFLAPVASICLMLGWHPAAVFVAFIAVLTGSSFTFLALVAGFLIWARYSVGKPFVRGVVVLGLLSGLVAYLVRPTAQMFFNHGRFRAWGEALAAVKDAPILGHGPGSFRLLFEGKYESQGTWELAGGHFKQLHNDYLQVLFEAGALGAIALLFVMLCLLLAYYCTWWRHEAKHLTPRNVRLAQAALAPLLVNALGNFPFQISPHYFIGVFCAAILLRSVRA